MFQYAAGRSLSIRNRIGFLVDIRSGFIRDKVFNRKFALEQFDIKPVKADIWYSVPFWVRQTSRKLHAGCLKPITENMWGTFLYEPELRFIEEIARAKVNQNAWMDGYWQSERYFEDLK